MKYLFFHPRVEYTLIAIMQYMFLIQIDIKENIMSYVEDQIGT